MPLGLLLHLSSHYLLSKPLSMMPDSLELLFKALLLFDLLSQFALSAPNASQTPASMLSGLPSDFNFTCGLTAGSDTTLLDPFLRSKQGSFAWGFTSSFSDELPFCSLSIVCYNCESYFPAWSASSDQTGAVVSGAHILRLGANRVLELRDSANVLIWSSNAGDVQSIELLEEGNLLLLDSQNSIVWQSFDHPSNVLLPGQILTPGMRLVAGDYSAVVEAGGLALYVNSPDPLPYLVLNSSWGLSTLDSVLHPVCTGLSLVYTASGDTLTMELDIGNASATSECYSPAARNSSQNFNLSVTESSQSRGFRYLKLDFRGGLQTFLNDSQDFSWFSESDDNQARGFCNLPNHCGEYGICDPGGECRCPKPVMNQSTDSFFDRDYSVEAPDTDSCSLVRPVNCSTQTSGNSYKLLHLQDLEYFPHRFMSPHVNTTQQICVSSCVQNCSCVTAFYNKLSNACHHYSKTLSMQRATYGGNYLVFLKIIPVDEQQPNSTHHLNFIAIAVIVGTSLIATSIILLWVYRHFRRRGMEDERIRRTDDDVFLDSLAGLPPRYSVKQLQQITNKFSVKLGQGGFGSVYEGMLPDDTKIAVKKLEGTNQGDKEFRAEVAALAGLSHVNLVRLRGFCAEGVHRMLVYEYMANGSLDKWLPASLKNSEAPLLDWQTRFRIAIDAARGLAFLHGESRERIFHLDVKPQNILLDENFEAKLADFGLSKQVERGRSRTETAMRGTPGYLAPEWLLQLTISDKSDVYSFGMVLMELVSGSRNVNYSRASEQWYWPAWAVKKAVEGRWDELKDEAAKGWGRSQGGDEEAERAIKVALWCLQEDPKARPGMAMVLLMLEGHVEVGDPPLKMQFTLETQAKLLANSHTEQQEEASARASCLSPSDHLLPQSAPSYPWNMASHHQDLYPPFVASHHQDLYPLSMASPTAGPSHSI